MSYITPQEISTHLYAEQIAAIGGDETLQQAINAATAEAAGYLQSYDMKAEFAKTAAARNANLVMFIKDIAIWHYINICNVNTDLDLRLKRYELAVKWLVGVQKGSITPDLPAKKDENGAELNTTPFKVGSNPKRVNHI